MLSEDVPCKLFLESMKGFDGSYEPETLKSPHINISLISLSISLPKSSMEADIERLGGVYIVMM